MAKSIRADPCLPAAFSVPVAVVDPVRTAHAGGGAGELVDLGGHQAVAGEGQELADQVGIGTFSISSSSAILSSVIVVVSGSLQRSCNPNPYRRPAMTASRAARLRPTR